MEVLDLIYHWFFFTRKILGGQPTISCVFQPLAPQTLVLVPAAIHCALSQYATRKKVTVMFSQDEYWGKFCPSMVIDCITAEAIALINYTRLVLATGPNSRVGSGSGSNPEPNRCNGFPHITRSSKVNISCSNWVFEFWLYHNMINT